MEPYPTLTVSPEPTHEEVLAAAVTLAATVDTTGIHLQVHARKGGTVRTILDEAKTLPADLIVVGTHRFLGLVDERAGFSHLSAEDSAACVDARP